MHSEVATVIAYLILASSLCSAEEDSVTPSSQAHALPSRSSASPAPSLVESPEVLILGGGAERNAAEAWRERWTQALIVYNSFLEPSPDFPKVVQAEDGSYVAILGICRSDEIAAQLALLKSIYPETHAQKVVNNAPLSFPRLLTTTKAHTSKMLQKDGWQYLSLSACCRKRRRAS
ncbi:MAG TPA: hypothetical protein VHK24_00570 [Steroidobacter sp.]|nr:hypothetical protein [Steroidobacter sp.]